jgi:hypothetical protein
MQAMRRGEGLVDRHLVGPLGLRQAALPQMQKIEALWRKVGHRYHSPGRGLLHSFQVEQRELGNAHIHSGHARNGPNLLLDRLGRAPDVAEHIGEAVTLVIGAACLVERAIGAAGQHEGCGACRHHQGNCQGLRPHAPQVSNELAVEHAHGCHQLISDGALRLSFTSVAVMRPSPKKSTRCAMSLMGRGLIYGLQ